MTTVDVPSIDPVGADGARRELATRLTDVLRARDRAATPGEAKRWMVVAQAVPSGAGLERRAARRVADLDYAAWHAHLAGTRRWVPGQIVR